MDFPPIFIKSNTVEHGQDFLLVFAVSKGTTEIELYKGTIYVPAGAAAVVPSNIFSKLSKNKRNTSLVTLGGELVKIDQKKEIFYVKNGYAFVKKCIQMLEIQEKNTIESSVLAYRLLLEIRENSCLQPPQKDSVPLVVESAINIMNTDSASLYNIMEIAEEIGVSLPYLSREFKRYMGISPSSYLRNIRIENAKSMLEDMSVSVTIVGELCGFSGVDYFCRVFKKSVGLTPSEYRSSLSKKRRGKSKTIPDEAYL